MASLETQLRERRGSDGFLQKQQTMAADVQTVSFVDLTTGGIFTATLVALFGGVRTNFSGLNMKVHPVFLMILCLPVLTVQLMALCFLWEALPLETKISDVSETNADIRQDPLVKLKWVMVLVLFLHNYKNLSSGLSHLVFTLNPMTWIEVKHPRAEQWLMLPPPYRLGFDKACSSPPTLISITAFALLCKFVRNYLVCVVSVNIILAAKDAQAIIFNGLAISFIVDLDETWSGFCRDVFHILPYSTCQFSFRSEVWKEDSDGFEVLSDKALSKVCCPSFFTCLNACTGKYLGLKSCCLRVRHGGSEIMQGVVWLQLFLIYGRQLLVMLRAMLTNRLPALRDTCSGLNLVAATQHYFPGWALDTLGTVAMQNKTHNMQTSCHNLSATEMEDLRLLSWKTHAELIRTYPWTVLIFALAGLCFLIVPFIANKGADLRHKLVHQTAGGDSDSSGCDDEESSTFASSQHEEELLKRYL